MKVLREAKDRDLGMFHRGGICDLAIEGRKIRGGRKSFQAVEDLAKDKTLFCCVWATWINLALTLSFECLWMGCRLEV